MLTEVRLSGYTSLVPIMVAVAQLAERQIVALEVAGSSPVGHPQACKSALSAEINSTQGIRISWQIVAKITPKTPESGGLWRSFSCLRDLQIHIGDTVLAILICSRYAPA